MYTFLIILTAYIIGIPFAAGIIHRYDSSTGFTKEELKKITYTVACLWPLILITTPIWVPITLIIKFDLLSKWLSLWERSDKKSKKKFTFVGDDIEPQTTTPVPTFTKTFRRRANT